MRYKNITIWIFTIAISLGMVSGASAQSSILLKSFMATPGGYMKSFHMDPGLPGGCTAGQIALDADYNIKVCKGPGGPWDDPSEIRTDVGTEVYLSEDEAISTDFVGIGTATPQYKLTLEQDGGFFAVGTHGSGVTHDGTAGTVMLWNPRKSAFSAGYFSGSQLTNSRIGEYSVRGGKDTMAAGAAAVAFGDTNVVNIGVNHGTVSGGLTNVADAHFTTVSGGTANTASDTAATVGGGNTNTASGDGATVAGGYNNQATADHATIGGGGLDGGSGNTASATGATISGGYGNTASGSASAIGGGWSNQATGSGNTVGGGSGNIASGDMRATIAGGNSNDATARYSFIGGGSGNEAHAILAAVSGGSSNIVYTRRGYVGGGEDNIIGTLAGADDDAEHATIGGGRINEINMGDHSTIAGGWNNLINHANDVVTVGATIAGGTSNTITEEAGFIGGGSGNAITGYSGSVPGGSSNTVNGDYSWAGGRGTTVSGNGSFGWGYNGAGGVLDLTNDYTAYFYPDGNGKFIFNSDTFAGTEDFHVAGDSRLAGTVTVTGAQTNNSNLTVQGNSSFQGTVTASSNVTVGGMFRVMGNAWFNLKPVGMPVNINAQNMGGGMYQLGLDYAEEFIATERIEPAEVVVADPDNALHVKKSSEPYQTSAIGIASSHPAVVLKGGTVEWGFTEEGFQGGKEVPLAVAGRVLCKVSSENGPIQIGDLLTTSSTPGHAMKVTDRAKAIGAIIGKAMEPFDGSEESGAIVVFVTTQ